MSRALDLDRHVVEPEGLWREAFGASERERLREAFRIGAGGGAVHPPGMDCSPAARSGDLRALVRELDHLEIGEALLVPARTVAHFPWLEDAEAARLFARAANTWWAAACREVAADRLLPLAVLPAGSLDDAIAELEHARALGFRAAWICPAFDAAGRHPGQRALRPLWDALAASGMAAYVHAAPWCPPGSQAASAGIVRDGAEPLGADDAIAAAIAPAMDCAALLLALLADGVLEALPRLRLIFADAGAAWLPLALEKAESALWLCHQDEPVCLDPPAVFAAGEHLVACDAHDGTLQRMPARFARCGAWGSGAWRDSPAPAATLRGAGIPEDLVRALAGENARRVLRLSP